MGHIYKKKKNKTQQTAALNKAQKIQVILLKQPLELEAVGIIKGCLMLVRHMSDHRGPPK